MRGQLWKGSDFPKSLTNKPQSFPPGTTFNGVGEKAKTKTLLPLWVRKIPVMTHRCEICIDYSGTLREFVCSQSKISRLFSRTYPRTSNTFWETIGLNKREWKQAEVSTAFCRQLYAYNRCNRWVRWYSLHSSRIHWPIFFAMERDLGL